MDDIGIRARRAAGESLHQIWCRSCSEPIPRHFGRGRPRQYCSDACRLRCNGYSIVPILRKPVEDTERSYVKHKMQIGKCSTDFAVIPVSLARSAAHYG